MSSVSNTFLHPPLPDGADAIRILTLDPGEFAEPLIGSLESVTFSSKPKFVALSYTWSDPYPDDAELPIDSSQDGQTSPRATLMTLDGYPFPLQQNLYLAMQHLRSPTHKLLLWIDAICINQVDTEERNSQVALMSFIYTRATKAIGWLGVKAYGNKINLLQCMSSDWKAGQARQLASSLAEGTTLRYSLEPDLKTFSRITESTYWSRIWVVQEVCLPRLLVFVYGSKLWRFEDLINWGVLQAARTKHLSPGIAHDVSSDGFGTMLRLLQTRDARHTNAARLENLIGTFASSRCSEVRDKVYAILGFSNDAFPYSEARSDSSFPEHPGSTRNLGPNRRSGAFRVDYARSLYDIWVDVVEFVYFHAECLNGRFRNDPLSHWRPDSIVPAKVERCVSVVRTASIAQKALGQMLEHEMANRKPHQARTCESVRALGYLGGKIIHLGPDYDSLIGSFMAQQDWVNCWRDYNQDIDVETVRKTNENYYAKITEYGDDDVARIKALDRSGAVGWYVSRGKPEVVQEQKSSGEQNSEEDVRICLATNNQIALVPSSAKVDDVIVRFWNCHAAMLMRPSHATVGMCHSTQFQEGNEAIADVNAEYLMLVGRADVADNSTQEENSEFDIYAEERLFPSATPGRVADAIHIEMDFSTLQIITAGIHK